MSSKSFNVPQGDKRVSVHPKLLTKMMSFFRKQISVNDRNATTMLKMKKHLISKHHAIIRLRKENIVLKRRLRAKKKPNVRSSVKEYVSALKQIKLVLNFQGMHIKSLVKMSAKKDYALKVTKTSYKHLAGKCTSSIMSLNTTYGEAQPRGNTSFDQSVNFGDVTLISKYMRQ